MVRIIFTPQNSLVHRKLAQFWKYPLTAASLDFAFIHHHLNNTVTSKFIFTFGLYYFLNLIFVFFTVRTFVRHVLRELKRILSTAQTLSNCYSFKQPLHFFSEAVEATGRSLRSNSLNSPQYILHPTINMSGKLDQSLDEILSTRRKANRGRRPHKPAKATGRAVKAPVGGVKKSVRPTRSATKGAPTGPSAPSKESKIIVTGLVSLAVRKTITHTC